SSRASSSFFFFTHTPPSDLSTLSLHDALPIFGLGSAALGRVHVLLRDELGILRANVLHAACFALQLITLRFRLDQLGAGVRHSGLGLGHLRLEVATLEPRDHLTALHVRPFAHSKVGETT